MNIIELKVDVVTFGKDTFNIYELFVSANYTIPAVFNEFELNCVHVSVDFSMKNIN